MGSGTLEVGDFGSTEQSKFKRKIFGDRLSGVCVVAVASVSENLEVDFASLGPQICPEAKLW